MLCATNIFTASRTLASSSMQKSILLYPLSSAASPAVKAVPTVLKARGAAAPLLAAVRVRIGRTGRNIGLAWLGFAWLGLAWSRRVCLIRVSLVRLLGTLAAVASYRFASFACFVLFRRNKNCVNNPPTMRRIRNHPSPLVDPKRIPYGTYRHSQNKEHGVSTTSSRSARTVRYYSGSVTRKFRTIALDDNCRLDPSCLMD